MKFKNFFIVLSILTISMPAMAMKGGFFLSRKEQKEKKGSHTNEKQKEEIKQDKQILRYTLEGKSWQIPIGNCAPMSYNGNILHRYVIEKKEKELIECLERGGTSIDVQDDLGLTPLYHAVMQKNLPMAKVLLERGAKPNIANCIGFTPLDMAQDKNLEELSKLLIQYGAKNSEMTDEDLEIEITQATLEKVITLPEELKKHWGNFFLDYYNEKDLGSQADKILILFGFCKQYNIPISKSGK